MSTEPSWRLRVKLIMVMTTFNESCGCAQLDGDYTQMASSYNMYHSRNTFNTMRNISMLMLQIYELDCMQHTDGNQRSMQA